MEDPASSKITASIDIVKKALLEEHDNAKEAWDNDKEALTKIEKELKVSLEKGIEEKNLTNLLQNKVIFEQIKQPGNLASELAKGIAADDVAKNLTSAAKSINQALSSIENANSAVIAMRERVNDEGVVVATAETKKIMERYTKSTQKILEQAENCKKEAVEIVLTYTKDIKLNLEEKIGEIASLPSKLQIMEKDLEELRKKQQGILDEKNKVQNDKLLEKNTRQLCEIKSQIKYNTLNTLKEEKTPETSTKTTN
tara:strand:+ start:688 stop:1452 length:765 start_codon:yes stop_codon:yes gene_type:complete